MVRKKIHTFLTDEQADLFLQKVGKETISQVGNKILEEYLKTPVKKLKPERYCYVVSLCVSDEMLAKIKARAKQSECSIASLIRDAIKDYLEGKISV